MIEFGQEQTDAALSGLLTPSYFDILLVWLELLPNVLEEFSTEKRALENAAEQAVRMAGNAVSPLDKNYEVPVEHMARGYLNNFLPRNDALVNRTNWSEENAILLAALFYLFIVQLEQPIRVQRVSAELRKIDQEDVLMRAYWHIASYEVKASKTEERVNEVGTSMEEQQLLARIQRQNSNKALLTRYRACESTEELIDLMCEVLQPNLDLYSQTFQNSRKLSSSPKVFRYFFGISISVLSKILHDKLRQKDRAAIWAQREVEQKIGLIIIT